MYDPYVTIYGPCTAICGPPYMGYIWPYMICGHYTIAQNHEGASYRIIIATYTASDHKTFHAQDTDENTLKYGRKVCHTRTAFLP